jgi:hypothetical protein
LKRQQTPAQGRIRRRETLGRFITEMWRAISPDGTSVGLPQQDEQRHIERFVDRANSVIITTSKRVDAKVVN